MRRLSALCAALLLAAVGRAAHGDDAGLAQQLAAPIAPLAYLPLFYDHDREVGATRSGTRDTLTAIPVVPFRLSADWRLITRTLLSYFRDQRPDGSTSGVGDLFPAFFLSPSRPGPTGISWGAGAVFQLRTASDPAYANEKWGAGPTAFIMQRRGPWSYGVLADHLWSFGGDESRPDYSQSFVQPFLNYTTREAWTFGVSSESVYDWKGEQWSAPVILSASKLLRLGEQPLHLGAGLRYFVDDAEARPHGWGLRLFVSLPLGSAAR